MTRRDPNSSQKYKNFHAVVFLNFAYYNFCKRHIAVQMTPAQAAGIEDHQWTVAELVERVTSKQDHLGRLQVAIQHMHRCGAVHVETVPVHEVFQGKTVWEGEVEVFIVTHPRANHCYAWSYHDDKGERIVAILEIPPVGDAKTAVQASILADSKKH